jgi:nucleotidyltransferase substrate binding protein (TIGR01987 family)
MALSLSELEKAVQRLAEALAQPKNEFIRDSVIQRFEFTVELSWKIARKVLGLTSTAPKVVLREMAQAGVILDPELWFGLLEARNLTSHSYNEEIAERIYQVASGAMPEFQSLLKALKR